MPGIGQTISQYQFVEKLGGGVWEFVQRSILAGSIRRVTLPAACAKVGSPKALKTMSRGRRCRMV